MDHCFLSELSEEYLVSSSVLPVEDAVLHIVRATP